MKKTGERIQKHLREMLRQAFEINQELKLKLSVKEPAETFSGKGSDLEPLLFECDQAAHSVFEFFTHVPVLMRQERKLVNELKAEVLLG